MPSAVTDGTQVIGVVLAGGRSTRMGRDKASLFHDGATLTAIAKRNLEASGVAHVFVSGPGGISDEAPGQGPLGGIATVARRLKGVRAMLIVPVDMPGLSPKLLARLAAAREPAAFDRYELPALLPTDDRFDLALGRALAGRRSVRELLDGLGAERLPVADDEAACFININTPEAWAKFSGDE